MTELEHMPDMAPAMERDFSGFSNAPAGDQMPVPYGGASVIVQSNRDTTAKRVAVPRDPGKIFAQINGYAASFGDQYVYSWQVKNRRENRMDTIEGGTIKLANMLLRAYGNSQADCDVSETKTHYVFKAFFVDFESGMSMSRLFQQRKSQNTGMADGDRQADIVFQIGQSKAIRNVILNALSDFAQHAIEQSKAGMVKKFANEEARGQAHDFIERCQERFGISGIAVDAVIGRARREWTIPNLARAYMLMRGVYDGLTSPEEAFPTDEAASDMIEGQAAEKQDVRSGSGKKTRGKAAKEDAPKTDEAPKGEQEKPDIRSGNEVHKQPDYKAAGPEAKAEAEKPQFDEKQISKIKTAYFDADDFETIQAIRANVADNHYQDAPGVAKAYEEAMARVKAANAARAKAQAEKPADEAPAAEQESEEPEVDHDLMADRVIAMFDGLDDPVEIGEALRKAAHVADQLDEAGEARFKAALHAAQERAELSKRATESAKLAAEEAAKREAPAETPKPKAARAALFSDDE